ncbi:MAG: TnpV protein [Clostridia bacterium]|nr:TnpV protein [Clostridia bacterium]
MKNELTYTKNGDYMIPDIQLSEQVMKPLGRYGRMRREYLKKHRPILWNQMILSEKLYPHLYEIEETANRRMEQMMEELTKKEGVTEEMKSENPMQWVQTMNRLHAEAEETILTELIYS